MKVVLGLSLFAALFLTVYFIVDRIIDNKRLKETQTAWDEYSKNMSKREKDACFIEWCVERKIENGWKFYCFPRM